MLALVNLPDNCGTNPSWDDWSWSNETTYTASFSVSLIMDTYFFPFVIHCFLLDVPNMHNAQRGTSSFKYKNRFGRNPSFYSLNMDFGCRRNNFPFQNLNSCCKGDRTSVNMRFWIFNMWYSLITLYNPLGRLELIQCMTHYLFY